MNSFQNKRRRIDPSSSPSLIFEFPNDHSSSNDKKLNQLYGMIQTQNLLIQELYSKIKALEDKLNTALSNPPEQKWAEERPSYFL